eukprot:m.881140 g.881140  ORF g.881140 m.881140 type:complete len:374 (-) comp23593_c0_seq43:736-1857(-)
MPASRSAGECRACVTVRTARLWPAWTVRRWCDRGSRCLARRGVSTECNHERMHMSCNPETIAGAHGQGNKQMYAAIVPEMPLIPRIVQMKALASKRRSANHQPTTTPHSPTSRHPEIYWDTQHTELQQAATAVCTRLRSMGAMGKRAKLSVHTVVAKHALLRPLDFNHIIHAVRGEGSMGIVVRPHAVKENPNTIPAHSTAFFVKVKLVVRNFVRPKRLHIGLESFSQGSFMPFVVDQVDHGLLPVPLFQLLKMLTKGLRGGVVRVELNRRFVAQRGCLPPEQRNRPPDLYKRQVVFVVDLSDLFCFNEIRHVSSSVDPSAIESSSRPLDAATGNQRELQIATVDICTMRHSYKSTYDRQKISTKFWVACQSF